MPIAMCESNVVKNAFVLKNIDQILDCLTRGLDLNILARGYGEEGRGVTVSYQAQCDALGAVLPSNSPGVHTLWLPVIALQMGLVLKPGSSASRGRPTGCSPRWSKRASPARRSACTPAPGPTSAGRSCRACRRAMIFGGPQTVEQYAGNPRVQVHGPGYSKIIFGDDQVDNWEQHVDMMVDSVYRNGGRSCINCTSIYASRHTKEIAETLAEKLGPIEVLPPDDPNAGLAAFTIEGAAKAIYGAIERDVEASPLVTNMTEKHGDRLVEKPPVAYLRPVVLHHASHESESRNKEYMFPMVNVVECPQAKMLKAMEYTLVGTAITDDDDFRFDLISSTEIDRLNLGPIPTPKLDWLQPHEGNLIEFLYQNRALQLA